MRVQHWLKWVKDTLFPMVCARCGQEGSWLCDKCDTVVMLEAPLCCPTCRRENYSGVRDAACVGALDGIVSLFKYSHGEALSKLIGYFKYDFALETVAVFEKCILRFLEQTPRNYPFFSGSDWVIIPIALHARRERERGFNQAAVVAEILYNHLAQWPNLDISYEPKLLMRTAYTQQQALLDKADRERNMAQVFTVRKNIDLSEKKVLLVDDVYTTGATMQAAAEVLKKQGASMVWGFTLGQG